jgi:hypothetical protein
MEVRRVVAAAAMVRGGKYLMIDFKKTECFSLLP